jgi:molecular chaperone HscB
MTHALTNMAEREGDCWRCAERIGLSAFCSSCEAPQPLAPEADHFVVLGVPRCLDLDGAELERRYHEASRRVHPDRHQTAGPREQELSLAASAALNRAYRTLRDPVARGRYWLELHGDAIGLDNNRVPPALADLVFDVQEQLAELHAGRGDTGAVRVARGALAERLAILGAGLEARYRGGDDPDSPAALADLKCALSEVAYLRTLLRDVDAGLGG